MIGQHTKFKFIRNDLVRSLPSYNTPFGVSIHIQFMCFRFNIVMHRKSLELRRIILLLVCYYSALVQCFKYQIAAKSSNSGSSAIHMRQSTENELSNVYVCLSAINIA